METAEVEKNAACMHAATKEKLCRTVKTENLWNWKPAEIHVESKETTDSQRSTAKPRNVLEIAGNCMDKQKNVESDLN